MALAVGAALADGLDEHLDRVRRLHLLGGGALLGGLLLGVLAFGTTPVLGVGLVALGGLAGGGAVWYARDQEPDVEVTGVRKRYWSAHLFSRGESTIVYDATDGVERSEFVLEELENPGVLAEAREELDRLDDLPIVMARDDDVEARIRRTLERVHAEITASETTRVDAPIVDRDDPLVESLHALTARASDGAAGSDGVEIPVDAARKDVRVIERLEELAFEDDAEDELVDLKRDSQASVERLSQARSGAVELLNDHIGTAADVTGLATYNFYCPHCAADDVESRLAVGLGDETYWYCSACDGRFEEEVVVPRHQVRDELVTDVWDQLWIEKDDQRRRIYERIEDQKEELKEREFEQQREEIRTATGRIKDVRSKIRDLKTQAMAGEGAVDEIGSLMVKYERLNEQRKEEFRRDVEAALERIDEETEEILEETRNVEQERIEAAEEEAERRAKLMRAEEELRHREKLAARTFWSNDAWERVDARMDLDIEEELFESTPAFDADPAVGSGAGVMGTIRKNVGVARKLVGGR